MPRVLQNLYFMVNRRYQQTAFKPYTIQRTIAGMPFAFYIGDPVAKEWYDTGKSTWPEMEYHKNNILKPGDVVIECGAHQGFTTCFFAKCVGEKGHVVAFEPSSFNTDIIKKNLDLNKIAHAAVETKAIGAELGKAHFSYVSNASLQSNPIGTFEVAVTTIDSYAKLRPTVLKLDVEGYEVEALKGARKVLRTRPSLAIEIHTQQLPEYGHTVKDVFDQLDLSDYTCTIMGPDGFRPLGKPEDITTNVHLFAVPK